MCMLHVHVHAYGPCLDPAAVPPQAQLVCDLSVQDVHGEVDLERRVRGPVDVLARGELAHTLFLAALEPRLVLRLDLAQDGPPHGVRLLQTMYLA